MGALARAGPQEVAPKAPSAPAAGAPISNARRDSAKSALDISVLLHSLVRMRGFDISRHPSDRRPAGALPGHNLRAAELGPEAHQRKLQKPDPGSAPACCRRITPEEVIAKLMYTRIAKIGSPS